MGVRRDEELILSGVICLCKLSMKVSQTEEKLKGIDGGGNWKGGFEKGRCSKPGEMM